MRWCMFWMLATSGGRQENIRFAFNAKRCSLLLKLVDKGWDSELLTSTYVCFAVRSPFFCWPSPNSGWREWCISELLGDVLTPQHGDTLPLFWNLKIAALQESCADMASTDRCDWSIKDCNLKPLSNFIETAISYTLKIVPAEKIHV